MKLKILKSLFLSFLFIGALSCKKDDEPVLKTTNTVPTIEAQGFSVAEDIDDTFEIGVVQAIDAENDVLTFSITTNANDLFEITQAGVISLATGKSLDFEAFGEAEPTYTITVTVTDENEGKASAQITITVENVVESLFEGTTSFITKWNIPSDGFELEIGLGSEFDYSFTVDWGDGTEEEYTVTNSDPGTNDYLVHTYETQGEYRVAIGGDFPSINMANTPEVSQQALTDVEQWGNIMWKSLEAAFYGASNLMEFSTADRPDLSNTTSLASMFAFSMFNGNIGDWDISNVQSLSDMFENATAFNQGIGQWVTENVISMNGMFDGASSFNQDIGGWDISKVETMAGMFREATAFNQDIGQWKTGNVTAMNGMFQDADSFDQDISSWDTSQVTTMQTMFWNNNGTPNAFNQNISGWDVSKVSNFGQMFQNAENFNQNLADWNIQGATLMPLMLSNSGMSVENYSNTLIGWSKLSMVPLNISLGAQGLFHNCPASTAKTDLENNIGWTITDDGLDPDGGICL